MLPDKKGHFGIFGGKYVPETLIPALEHLEKEYARAKKDKAFQKELFYYLTEYAGRPTPLYYAQNLSAIFHRKIYLKREDLLHTGAHKMNNVLGQILLARRMKKTRIIAETGAGQHGVATATAAALFGLECHVYMGEEDMRRQEPNVFRMKLLGAEVIPVRSGSRTLKDATSEAIRDWVTNVKNTYYVIGSVIGPHPYPMMVRDFQSVIGKETRRQILKKAHRLPDYLMACVGGGSNAMGMFYPFLNDTKVVKIGVEAAGLGVNTSKTAASILKGRVGVLHGTKSLVLQDKFGQIQVAHSISAGLDYPGVGPEHSFYHFAKRIRYVAATDKEALDGFTLLSRKEGILPALEPSHAIGYVQHHLSNFKKNSLIVICLSGRGDKDLPILAPLLSA